MNRGIRVLQTLALPLGYVTIGDIYIICELQKKVHIYFRFQCPHFRVGIEVERATRLELATSTLARWRSTR